MPSATAEPAVPRLRVIVAAVGTLGDLLPATALAAAAARRGHDVHMLANDAFAGLIRGHGLAFHSTGDAESFQAFIDGPAWQGEDRGWSTFLSDGIVPAIAPTGEHIARLAADGPATVAVAFNYAYGARHAARTLGLPLVHAFIQPAMFDALAGLPGPAAEIPAARDKAAAYARAVRAAEGYFTKIYFANSVTAPLESTPGPETYLGLFPRWLAPPGPGWPSGVRLSGLPLIDTAAEADMPTDVARVLDAGPPPVGLYCGSFMRDARTFFEVGLEACRRLGRRAIVVHRYAEDLPDDLPGEVFAARVVPFGRLIPRLAALVHQGGIGTAAQALAAGVPQVCIPLLFDQASNTGYLVRLGVARAAAVEDGPERLMECLESALTESRTARACADYASRMATDNPFESAVVVVEEAALRASA